MAYQIAEFSRLSGVTKIVLGRGETSNRILFWKPSLTERLVELTPELDIHIILTLEQQGGLPPITKKSCMHPRSPSWIC